MINIDALTDEEWDFVCKEGHRVQAQLKRARREGAIATLALHQWLTIINTFDGKCAYCQHRDIEVMDHLIPLPQGGTTADNVVPACHICNVSKGKRSAHINHETRSIVIHPLPHWTVNLSNMPTCQLSANEAAEIANVTVGTIFRWASQGLRHSRVGEKERYSIDPEDLKAFILRESIASPGI